MTAFHRLLSLWSMIMLKIFSATLLPRQTFFILYLYMWFLPLKCSTLHLFSLNFILLISSSPFNFSRSFWILIMPSKLHPTPPSSVWPANFISKFPIPLPKLLIKLSNKNRSKADPCRTPLEMPSPSMTKATITTLWELCVQSKYPQFQTLQKADLEYLICKGAGSQRTIQWII